MSDIMAANAEEADRIGLFDMDGSLADFDGGMRHWLERMRAPEEPPLPANMWDLERLPHVRERMRLVMGMPGWWRSLPEIPDGFTVLEIARDIGYHIDILTKGPTAHPLAWAEKLQWCQDHLSQPYDVHVTMNKGLVYGTFLYDDYPDYMLRWLRHRPRGLGIMPVTESNRVFVHPQVIKWDGSNLDQVRQALESAYTRRPKDPLVLPTSPTA